VIHKWHNTGKLITDLSFPEGFSVNQGIDFELCLLYYVTMDEVASIVDLMLPLGLHLALKVFNAVADTLN